VIAAVETGEKKYIALRFCIPASTLSTILKQKDHLNYITNLTHRGSSRENVSTLIWKNVLWFGLLNAGKITFRAGPILKEKKLCCLKTTRPGCNKNF